MGISLVQVLITILLFGIYVGWVDDVYHILMLKGSVLREQTGYLNLMFHLLTGYLYSGLYRVIPGVNWWGAFMLLYTVFIVIMYNALLLHLIRDVAGRMRRPLVFVLFSFVFYGAFLAEQVFLLNATRIALSLTFTGFLAIMVLLKHHKDKPYFKWLLGLSILICVIGWATRFNIVMLLFPAMAWFAFSYLEPKEAFKSSVIGGFLALMTVGLAWAVLTPDQKVAQRETMRVERQILSYLDGLNRNEINHFSNQRDSIKARSFYNWYFADVDTLLDASFLDKLQLEPTSGVERFYQWQDNFQRQLDRAENAYTGRYMPDWNWYNKTLLLLGILLLLPFGFFWDRGLRKYWYVWLIPYLMDAYFLYHWNYPFLLFIWLLLIPLLLFKDSLNIQTSLFRVLAFNIVMFVFLGGLAAILKMEDRFLSPTLLFIFIGQWLLVDGVKATTRRRIVYILIPVLLAVTYWRIPQYQRISQQRSDDLKIKKQVREEILATYPDRVVFFDLYTCTLLETSPLKDENLPATWIAGVETHNMAALPHLERIEKHVGCIDWPCFFDNISKHPDQFVFCAMRERVKITEEYNRIIYDRPLRFKKESDGFYIDSLQYSFIWSPWKLGYFTIDTSTVETPSDSIGPGPEIIE